MELSLEFFIFQRERAANNISSNLSSLTNSTVDGEHSVLVYGIINIYRRLFPNSWKYRINTFFTWVLGIHFEYDN
jgi:hypothetical protein